LKIVFCLPGRSFSDKFLMSWTNTLGDFFKRGIQVEVVSKYSSNVYYVRNMCLGGDNLQGVDQKPWQGNVDYDYIMWIDSDTVFTPDQVIKLIMIAESYDEVNIVSGLYVMENNTEFATVVDWNMDYFKQNGRFHFLSKKELKTFDSTKMFEVAYTGLGFMLVKKGVFETVGYPWFRPIWEEATLDNGTVVTDFTSEDVGFCRTAISKGYKIHIDPKIIVGHEKSKVLY